MPSARIATVCFLLSAIFYIPANCQSERRVDLDVLKKTLFSQFEAADSGAEIPPSPFEEPENCRRCAEFRTIDGDCNNLESPLLGASDTPEPRLVFSLNRFGDGRSSPTDSLFESGGPLPSARTVSLAVHLTDSDLSDRNTHILMNFGQLLDHELILTPFKEAETASGAPDECCGPDADTFTEFGECFSITVEPEEIFTRKCIPVVRSVPVPGFDGFPIIRYQLNEVTSFIDGSMVYGSNDGLANFLREFEGGLLRTKALPNNEEGLPLALGLEEDQCLSGAESCRFAAGDVRNSEQAGLTSMHTLFVRQHNLIAGLLAEVNPEWDDERLYQQARKIVGAQIQRIVYNEWLPEILGPIFMKKFALFPEAPGQRFTGYTPKVDASVTTEFGMAFRFGHSLIRQFFSAGTKASLDIGQVFQTFDTLLEFGYDSILEGLASDAAENLDRFLTTGVRDNLFNEELDLAAFNIQRGRDHGLPSYNDVRKYCGLKVFKDYKSIVGVTHTLENAKSLESVYPVPGDIELFPGGLSEIPVKGSLLGETFGCIVGLQFKKARFGDRFWHETDDRRTGFTDAQLAEIRNTLFSDVFCNNVGSGDVQKFLFKLPNSKFNPMIKCRKFDLSAWKGDDGARACGDGTGGRRRGGRGKRGAGEPDRGLVGDPDRGLVGDPDRGLVGN